MRIFFFNVLAFYVNVLTQNVLLQNHSPFHTRLPVISLTCDLELIGTICIPDTTVVPNRHAIQHSAGICELDLEVHV